MGETPSAFATVLLRKRRNCCVEAAIYGSISLIPFNMSLIAKFVGDILSVSATDLLRKQRNCCVEAAIFGYIGLIRFDRPLIAKFMGET
ncbi:hypothetical protein RBK84_00035, partial [Pseudomonas aeruginosa]|uniref:hypothetical protein n=1 Tax=Pseudomonas aeruginosa TaxID=287 RepID=UPI0027D3EFFA